MGHLRAILWGEKTCRFLAHGDSKRIKDCRTAPASLPRNSEKHAFAGSAKREGGHGFHGDRSPNLVPHTTSALFFPMDPYAPIASRLSFPYGSMFARRRGLVIAPGCATLAGMAKQAPLPKQRHYRNPARKSSGASSRHSRSPRGWALSASFANGSTCWRCRCAPALQLICNQ
jgi:hypothetical protein